MAAPAPRRRLALALVSALCGAVLLVLLGLGSPGEPGAWPVRVIEHGWQRWMLRATAPAAPDERLLVVAIDEAALAARGRWPWPREQLAALIRSLVDEHGAKVVGMDLLLSESQDGGDQALAQALVHRPVVLGLHLQGVRDGHPWPEVTHVIRPAAALRATVPDAGFLDVWVDADGVRRRGALAVLAPEGAVPAFALAVARRAAGAHSPLRLFAGAVEGARGLQAIGADGLVWWPHRPASALAPTLSAEAVLSGSVPDRLVRDRIVLVGVTAAGLGDRHVTPLAAQAVGIQAHAALVSALMDARVAHTPAWSAGAALGMATLLLWISAWSWQRRLRVGLLAGTSGLGLVLVLHGLAWAWFSWVLPVAGLVLLAMAALTARIAWGVWVQVRRRQELQALFGLYVPPEWVRRMSQDGQAHDMQARELDLTVMFADVQGFTSLSERLPAAELARLMNRVFDELTDAVRSHGGTLDKYIGDAVMAFWGAPLPEPEHAARAVAAANEIHQRVLALAPEFAARGWPPIQVGIGINSGPMAVGDFGSRHRKAYTVMGDAVNVAARLQELTRRLPEPVILGPGTAQRLPEGSCRPLGTQGLRGRRAAVPCFAPITSPPP